MFINRINKEFSNVKDKSPASNGKSSYYIQAIINQDQEKQNQALRISLGWRQACAQTITELVAKALSS